MDEVASLKTAKVGDKLNLTYLWTAIEENLSAENFLDSHILDR
jgi:hypothetical protein